MSKVKIFICCHKPYSGYRDEVYTPIHVGRSISSCTDQMQDMIGDNTGDNISEKNPYYCELTAQYWAWKNIHDVDYVGFCHYRRFFDINLKSDNIDEYLNKNTAVVSKRFQSMATLNVLYRYVSIEDVHIFLMSLKKIYPEYEKTVIDYLWNNELYQYNMLICKKTLFDDYAQWLFAILAECEKYMKISSYTRGKRAIAYLGEFFLPVYFMHNNIKLCNIDVVGDFSTKSIVSKQSIVMKVFMYLHYKLARRLIHKPNTLENYYYNEVLVGFKQDGISI